MSRVATPMAPVVDTTPAEPPRRLSSRRRRFAAQFTASKSAVVGLVVLILALAAAIFAPWLAPQNPFDLATLDILDAKLPPGSKNFDGSLTYWLGTDGQARDVFSAILYGLRISLFVGVVSVTAAFVIGAAYAGTDEWHQKMIDGRRITASGSIWRMASSPRPLERA